MGSRSPFSGGKAEESPQLGKVRVQEHRGPRSLGFLARAYAGITLEVESAGLARDWRFLICRRRAGVARGRGRLYCVGTGACGQQVGRRAELRPWPLLVGPQPPSPDPFPEPERDWWRRLSLGGGRAALLRSSGRSHSRGSPERRAERAGGISQAASTGDGKQRGRALAVTKFPSPAGLVTPLTAIRDRLGKGWGILNLRGKPQNKKSRPTSFPLWSSFSGWPAAGAAKLCAAAHTVRGPAFGET